jgi:hypothetical protein
LWNVTTRPIDKNGFGWLPEKTDVEISRLEPLLTVLPNSQAIYREWRKVVLDNSVLGKQVHDARIFKRFGHITLIDPNTI